MTWINTQTRECRKVRPERVRLPDLTTRTGPEVTDQVLADAGWIWVNDPPPLPYNPND